MPNDMSYNLRQAIKSNPVFSVLMIFCLVIMIGIAIAILFTM